VEPFNQELLKNAHWTLRNKEISTFLLPNKKILDMGCGGKDFLKYYQPSIYLGVDVIPGADLIIDLDTDFENKIQNDWDYVINSGILEYLENIESYLKKIKHLGKTFVFTWYQGIGYGRPSNEVIIKLLSNNYIIEKEINWGGQKIFLCIAR